LFVSTIARAETPALWLYYATNLQSDKNVDELEQIWGRAAKAGYSHVLLTDSKFARLGDLGDMTKPYMRNVNRVKQIAADLKLEVVPALFNIGYSNNLLWHDPNLAEGLPVKDALFEVSGGAARLVPDPPLSLAREPNWKDDSVSMADGVATVREHKGNARFPISSMSLRSDVITSPSPFAPGISPAFPKSRRWQPVAAFNTKTSGSNTRKIGKSIMSFLTHWTINKLTFTLASGVTQTAHWIGSPGKSKSAD
jgi:hypothetical protein